MSTTEQRADVALLHCESYEEKRLDEVIEHAASIAGFPDVRGATLLLKPNILNASPVPKAVTTNPAFLGAVIRFARSKGAARIVVGDSPGWQPGALAAKASGIYEAVQRNGAAWVDFRDIATRAVPNGKRLKNIPLTSLLNEVDLVINLPKLKNHQLMTYTGAMKNLFGLMPGTAKSAMHLQYPSVLGFGEMLVDLAMSVPCFSFMDGIIAMQGEGPGSGTPYQLGIVLASQSPAKLDWVAVQCVGYEPRRIPYLVDGMQRTLGSDTIAEPATFPLAPRELGHEGFERLPYSSELGKRLDSMPNKLRRFLGSVIRLRPIFHTNSCIGCSACVEICPAKALELEKRGRSNRIRINDRLCITCFCCHEVCPAKAISIGRAPLRVAHHARAQRS